MTDSQKRQIMRLRSAREGYGRIAQEVGISVNTVKSFCRRNKAAEEALIDYEKKFIGETTHCENCGQEIQQKAKKKRKRFCCDKCRNAWWNHHLDQVRHKVIYHFKCPHCGKEFQIYGDKRRKYCSHDCYPADRFKGGAAHA